MAAPVSNDSAHKQHEDAWLDLGRHTLQFATCPTTRQSQHCMSSSPQSCSPAASCHHQCCYQLGKATRQSLTSRICSCSMRNCLSSSYTFSSNFLRPSTKLPGLTRIFSKQSATMLATSGLKWMSATRGVSYLHKRQWPKLQEELRSSCKHRIREHGSNTIAGSRRHIRRQHTISAECCAYSLPK